MRTVQSAPASPALRRHVRAFAQRSAQGSFEDQPMPAYLETVIQFDFGDLPVVRRHSAWEIGRRRSVVGPHTSAGTRLRFDGKIDSFAIFLEPAALWSLFGIPISAVMETHFDADDVLGDQAARLWDSLAEARDFPSRVRLAEVFLHRRGNLDPHDTVTGAAVNLLVHQRGRITMSDLAWRLNVSVRQLERAFDRDVGMSPKRFARVARFQAALDARVTAPDRPWLQIANDVGYFDQMHLIHEFRSLGGTPPTRTLELLGDSRPAALAAANAH